MAVQQARSVRQASMAEAALTMRTVSLDDQARNRRYRRSCQECLLIVPLFALFMLVQHTHMSLASSYKIERVLKFQFLRKQFGNHSYTAADVHDAALFWDWLEVMLDETVAVQQDQLGSTLPREEWGYITGYNRIVGGVRLQQDRGSKSPCKDNPAETCYEDDTSLEAFGYPPCGQGGNSACYRDEWYAGSVNTAHDEGFSVDKVTGHFEMWLDSQEPRHVLKKRVEYLEERHWIDKQTRKVTIELLIRNCQFEPLVSEVIFRFGFDRTGYISETAVVETISAGPYSASGVLKALLGGGYVTMNVLTLAGLVQSWRVRCRQQASSAKRPGCLRSGGAELLSIALATAQIVLWSVYVPSVTEMLSRMDALQRPASEPRHDASDEHRWQDYHHEIADIERTMKQCVGIVVGLRELSSAVLFCLLVRTFTVWRGIPAFAAVTRTLEISAQHLGAVLLSAGTLLVLFSGAALLNYGTQLKEFHTIWDSLQQTTAIAVTGDPSVYDEMRDIDPIFAPLWFWGLIGLMFMVVLNLILGILVDAASAAAGGSTRISLLQQLRLACYCTPSPCCAGGEEKADGPAEEEEEEKEDRQRPELPDLEARASPPETVLAQEGGSQASGTSLRQ